MTLKGLMLPVHFKGLKENWTKQTGLCVSEF